MKPACWQKVKKPHPLCRPPSDHTPIVRLRIDHRWVSDNGDPGLAFIGPDPDGDGAIVYVANCRCKNYLDCPVSRALAFAGNRYATATVVRRRAVRSRKVDRVRRRRKR